MTLRRRVIGMIVTGAAVVLIGTAAEAAPRRGDIAPQFPALEAVAKRPLVLLYFFRLDSKPARDGLRHLATLAPAQTDPGFAIIAIGRDAPEALERLARAQQLPFPVVAGDAALFERYGVKVVLPTTVVLGPGGRVSDVLEGGGPASDRFLTTVADRTLALKKTEVARALYERALEANPTAAAARVGLGRVYQKQGKLDRAALEFSKIAQLKAPEAVLGKEALAELHLAQGETDKALAVAEEVARAQPDSGLVHLVNGNRLAAAGKQDAALAAFTRASEGKLATDGLRAAALNQAGRIYSERGELAPAETMYQAAVAANPYSAEILANRAVLYEKQGRPQQALLTYQQALAVDPEDEIARRLAQRMEQHLQFQQDMERQKRVDTLVAQLLERHKSAKAAAGGDDWSSRPLTVALLGFEARGALLREGMAEVLAQEIGAALAAAGRIAVVEREMLDKLLSELNLGASQLADPETALKLGRILSARLIVTGSLIAVPGGLRLALRVIDPETSAVKLTQADEFGPTRSLTTVGRQFGGTLAQRLRVDYPLKGRIAAVEDGAQVIVDLGSRHGITPGTRMAIVADGDPIVVNGRTIGHKKRRIGALEVTNVEERLSYAKLTEQQAKIEANQKVVEQVERQDEPVF